jgi:protein-disulfide isomerase
MSRKSQRNRPSPEIVAEQVSHESGSAVKKALFLAAGIVMTISFGVGAVVYNQGTAKQSQAVPSASYTALDRGYSPTAGNPQAKVQIVEFFDPACETCAIMFGHVKQLMADNPDKIRLTMRHIPFHPGADEVVKMLEASRNQDKYWETLSRLLSTQKDWTINHHADAQRAFRSLEGLGLNLAQLRDDMQSPAIAQRIAQDMADAKTLQVKATPEYFVNGKPLPQFGLDELKSLVRDELKVAYR